MNMIISRTYQTENLVQIFGHLSTYDVVRNVGNVSRKFHHLSEEIQHVEYFANIEELSLDKNHVKFFESVGRRLKKTENRFPQSS